MINVRKDGGGGGGCGLLWWWCLFILMHEDESGLATRTRVGMSATLWVCMPSVVEL